MKNCLRWHFSHNRVIDRSVGVILWIFSLWANLAVTHDFVEAIFKSHGVSHTDWSFNSNLVSDRNYEQLSLIRACWYQPTDNHNKHEKDTEQNSFHELRVAYFIITSTPWWHDVMLLNKFRRHTQSNNTLNNDNMHNKSKQLVLSVHYCAKSIIKPIKDICVARETRQNWF